MNQGNLLECQRWRMMVEAEHAQSEWARGKTQEPEDFWESFAERFRPEPSRTDDPVVQRLLQEVELRHTVIDVGAGGGRLALPFSLQCQQVVAVEPSASMGSILDEEAQRAQIGNIVLVPSSWEEAEIGAADIVLCVQVLYTVKDIVPFVRKLEAHAREKVLVVLYENPPQFQAHPLWPRVHGQKRLKLPCLRDFMQVLWEMDIYPDLEMLTPQEPRGFESRERALQQMRPRLLVAPGSHGEWRLEEALTDMLEEVDGRFKIRGVPPFRPALVSWQKRQL
ncbi:class I SAM-dependent methyltransferase [SAR202 cluster bacterium AC-647-N09_OGT_505m]|nr:class I SAM-dependent methyltransferase [SAR202 cluster bacterium AC-647-N09_OGT_505m]